MIMLSLVIASFAVYAQECTSALTDGCTVSSSLNVAPGTYTLPSGIKVIGNNLVLNCNGATLTGANGVMISIQDPNYQQQTGITIKNCIITNSLTGIETQNNLTYSVFQNNAITNAPLIILKQQGTNGTGFFYDFINITSNVGTNSIILAKNCDNSQITSNVITSNGAQAGIEIRGCEDTIIDSNTVTDGGKGIYVLNGGDINNNKDSHDNTFSNNNIVGNGDGIYLDFGSYSNTINSNTLDQNTNGLYLANAQSSSIHDNMFSSNSVEGLLGTGSSNNNVLYRNNFISNADNAMDQAATNFWNDTSNGNYWWDFASQSQGCYDLNFDNICDTPYNVNSNGPQPDPGNNVVQPLDYLPFVGQFNVAPAPQFQSIPDQQVNEMQTTTINAVVSSPLPVTLSVLNKVTLLPDPNFVINGNTISWQTNRTDAGVYPRVIVATDSNNLVGTENVTFTVNNVANTECGNSPKNSCTIGTQNSNWPVSQTFNFKDGVTFTGSGRTLNCNNAVLTGVGFNPQVTGYGITASGFNNEIIQNCNVQNYKDGIRLVNSNAPTITNTQSNSNSNNGIFLQNADSAQLTTTTVNNNGNYGILLDLTDNANIQSTTANQNSIGIALRNSNTNTFSGGTVQASLNEGIIVSDQNKVSNTNTFTGLTIDSNGLDGISVPLGSGNIIRDSTISNHPSSINYGISLSISSANSLIFRNNFINNAKNAKDTGSSNFWYSAGIGNYYSNFDTASEGCSDADINGICDAPFTFQFNQDNFPCANENPSCWINMVPVFTTSPSNLKVKPGQTWTYGANAIDPNGQTVTYSIPSTTLHGATINSATGLVSYTYNIRDLGNQRITIRASDGVGFKDQKFSLAVGIEDGLIPKK